MLLPSAIEKCLPQSQPEQFGYDAKCYEVVSQSRCPTGVLCPACGASAIVNVGGTPIKPIANAMPAERVVASLTT
jgi:hypothetical protein